MPVIDLVLHRRYFGPGFVAGELYVNGKRVCAALEYPWSNNATWDDKKDKSWNFFHTSCIREGIYKAQIRTDGHLGFRVELLGTPRRTGIEFHVGNLLKQDSQGCILAGEFQGGLLPGVKPRVCGSIEALKTLKRALISDASKAKNPADWAKMMGTTDVTVRIIGMPLGYWQTGR